KIPLRDLASGQVRSLPSKNVPLANENGQNIGFQEVAAVTARRETRLYISKSMVYLNRGAAGQNHMLSFSCDLYTLIHTDMVMCCVSQIRVRIIEARQLPGNNIKPVVKVSVCGQTHRTRIKRGNNPFFDENELFDSSLLDQNSLPKFIYLFYCSIFICVFLIAAHCVMRKWLLLNDPDDSSSGARGYLKVSLFIVGTGDEPPDDIESNLLLPAGVSLRWATLSVYMKLETFPNFIVKLGNKKNLVDPFLEACFAGKKIIEKNANPEWNQVLNLQVKVTCPTDKIITGCDCRDRLTRNDAVGTTYLNLSRIASSGGEIEANTGDSEVGFLPVFGPSYINLYGSPREFTGLPDPYEDLNFGKGEGVAYRGRILVELSTKLEGKVDKTVDSISSDDILVAQKYQRRRKYSLCAVFHSASMLQEPGEPIQFEVSIGNYGNKLDTTCKPLASTTQYSCAVFDGNKYYYLPWANTKPVVVITSFWEDISHRLDSVNIILYITHHLALFVCSLLPSFPTPELDSCSNLTTLDLQIKKLRDRCLATIKEGARRMIQEASEIKETLSDIESWADKLKMLAEEPQSSIPDVIIWMLRGEKRVACSRIPAHQILFSTHNEQACGQHCGKIQTIFLQNKGLKVPVQIRVNMWLGLSVHEKKFNSFSEGTFSVFAELYENQAKMFGKWGTSGLVGRHKYSDVTGKLKLKQEYFMPPRGWEWEGDWFIDPEKALLTEADAGHTEFTDEVYQNETRFPGGEWKAASEPYTDVNGEKSRNPGEFDCPPGWAWEDEWTVDINRAVDDQGWEYGVTIPPDDKPRSWVPAEKVYHVHRRRRLVRPRRRTLQVHPCSQRQDLSDPEGWEFSSPIGWKFHSKERSSDSFRRRRWRRRMAPEGRLGACAIFQLEGALVSTERDTDVKTFGVNTPFVSCSFDSSYRYHLRVYVYQARNLNSMDKDSFSDPYAHVSFLHFSKTTSKLQATLNPTWDQTLIFNDVEIYGNPENVAQCPPHVVLEFYDSDQVGKDEMLGRSVCPPLVKLNPGNDQTPKLLWCPIIQKGQKAGEALVAAELILKDKVCSEVDENADLFNVMLISHLHFHLVLSGQVDLPLVPPKRAENLYMVPQGIRPVVQLTAVEILAWGLRNMKPYQMATVSSPSLVVECGGKRVESAVIRNMKKSPNFPSSVLFIKVLLPKDEMYTPPIVLKVIDHRPFGRKPVVGQCTITSLEEFRCDPYVCTAEGESKPLLEAKEKETIDWWSKFYASVGDQQKCGPYLKKGYDTLKVYNSELENVLDFKGLTDFCSTFKLQRGKNENGDEDPTVVGEFKGSFKVYPLPDDPNVTSPPQQFRELPDSGPQECLVRIYVVQGIDLQPKDNNGLCDPYIKISLGKNTIDDRDHYIPRTLNPMFGRMFEMTCFLPQDKDLKISIYDYDLLNCDEKVGETVIDLENRFLSRYNSYCGLPQTYCISGINQWRDQLKPSQLLENLARMKGLSKPRTEDNGTSLTFNGKDYTLDNKEIHQHLGPPRERLCLHVLRTQGLVPEHVETRTLFSTFQPNLSQGRLQMWVDVFPKSIGPPGPPFDISPRKPKKCFLRAIIWNTTDVTLDETSVTGENMSDIYVKGWMPGMEEDKQKTDVHYRSLDGDGNFNWRFIFGFDYLPAEQLCLVSKKVRVSWSSSGFPPSTLELDLHNLISPAKSPEKCSLAMMDALETRSLNKSEHANSLFAQQSVRGWWPCAIEQDGKKALGGKVEMTLEIVTEADADERPAGKGRDEPNMNPKLDPPKRPETSFFWFTNPCKTMKFIVWKRFRCLFISLIILIIVLLFLAILLYSLPVRLGNRDPY
uniref:Myoferlin n=1 Tax=Mastacembelus armatus TaxID=205130 RepID=A0A7N8YQ95_9TELE